MLVEGLYYYKFPYLRQSSQSHSTSIVINSDLGLWSFLLHLFSQTKSFQFQPSWAKPKRKELVSHFCQNIFIPRWVKRNKKKTPQTAGKFQKSELVRRNK